MRALVFSVSSRAKVLFSSSKYRETSLFFATSSFFVGSATANLAFSASLTPFSAS